MLWLRTLLVITSCCLTLCGCTHESEIEKVKAAGQQAFAREDYAEAIAKFTEAVQLSQKQYGTDDPRTYDCARKLARVYNADGKCYTGNTILAQLNHLDDADVQKLGEAQRNAIGVNNQALNFAAENRTENALTACADTIERYIGKDPTLAPIYMQLGDLAAIDNQVHKAEGYYERAKHVYEANEGAKSVGVARIEVALAQANRRAGREEDAKKHFENAIGLCDEVLGPGSKQAKEIKRLQDAKESTDEKRIERVPEL